MRPAQEMRAITGQSRIRNKSKEVFIQLSPSSGHLLTMQYIMDWMYYLYLSPSTFSINFLPFTKSSRVYEAKINVMKISDTLAFPRGQNSLKKICVPVRKEGREGK